MYIKVRVFPGSKKEGVEEGKKGSFRVFVRAPAERNLANERVRELVALHFGVAVREVNIVTGHRSPAKILSVDIRHGNNA